QNAAGGLVRSGLDQLARPAERSDGGGPQSLHGSHASSSAGCAALASSAAFRAVGAYRPKAALPMSTARGSSAFASSSDGAMAARRAASPSTLIFANARS